MILRTTPQLVWDAAMLSVSGIAIWKGGRPERIVAVVNILASIASALVQDTRHWLDPQWGMLGVDLAFLAVLLWLALRSDRHWPMWAAAFQLLGVVTYVARMTDYRVGALAPFTAGVIWSYLVLLTLMIGTWAHWRSTVPTRG